MITSTKNPKIQLIRALNANPRQRREHSAFVIEGVRLTEEAVAAGWTIQWALHTETLSGRGQAVAARLIERGVPVETATPEVMASACDTQTPQGFLAVLSLDKLQLPLAPDFVLIGDGLRDPGNLGAILRTASAAGVQAVLLTPGSVDAFAPKVVRSAMGAHFRLPIHSLAWEEARAYLDSCSTPPRIYLADIHGEQIYTQADFRLPLALVVGGEAAGAGSEAHTHAASRVYIPMPGKAESLNAAIAAGILMFEVVRQRKGE